MVVNTLRYIRATWRVPTQVHAEPVSTLARSSTRLLSTFERVDASGRETPLVRHTAALSRRLSHGTSHGSGVAHAVRISGWLSRGVADSDVAHAARSGRAPL